MNEPSPLPFQASDALQALADPTRQQILHCLSQERLHVDELAARFPISRPAISKHLRQLKAAGLLVETREGRRSYYGVNLARLRELEVWLAEQRRGWQAGLARLKRMVEHDD
ncbi:ArsR/SmtB family transcription factor [Ideonella sp. BN130291]|uniref:ArsR/SmtB family transcription factor n=1 Tax=Ideonella sp. BN130291 TaxID=3112940 RepID=UPI002E26AB4F|nr:metalloregulator ArsR/SmtB family transcription factor [Ideonella sp. BN130291]